jgi:hypothetical protein
MRELEKAGLVELVEETRKGNCLERIVRAAGRCYVISPQALGKLGVTPDQRGDPLDVGFLVCLAARAIYDLTALCQRAGKGGKRLSTMALEVEVRFASKDTGAFAKELAQQVARLTAKYHDETAAGGRRYRFFGGVYPAITHEKPADRNRGRSD